MKMITKPLLIFIGILFTHNIWIVECQLCVHKTEDWDYVNIRQDANIFWWAYCNSAKPDAPLVLWLQGGPGGSSTGFGNFGEIGPLDVKQEPRNTTWLNLAHLLFIDNPVGAGFSYVTSDDAYTTDVWQIASDLLTTLNAFMKRNSNFQTTPFYIFSESYGGKMTAAFSSVLYKSIKAGAIKCNFMGLAMGDSWISPVDSVLTWGPYLFATSLTDEAGLSIINLMTNKTAEAVSSGQFQQATALWSETEEVIESVTAGVDFYNILKWDKGGKVHNSMNDSKNNPNKALANLFRRHVLKMQNDDLSELMNGPIRKKLGIIPQNVTWGGLFREYSFVSDLGEVQEPLLTHFYPTDLKGCAGIVITHGIQIAQSGKVFSKQSADFMKPVIDIVDELLESSLKVVVYSGQLDLIVDTIGTELWVQKLKWKDLPMYNKAKREPISTKDAVLAYVKSYQNFSFYWIMDAGHMVPADNGDAALEMLKMVTK